MIYESFYWKQHLVRRASFLEKKLVQKYWNEPAHAKLEQEIMLGFYSIRKLHDARKISDKTFKKSVKLMSFESQGNPINHQNRIDVDRHYKLENGKRITRSLDYVANQIIHSFIFMPVYSSESRLLEGIAFNSDKSKSSILFTMKIEEMIKTFNDVAADYPNKMILMKNENSDEYTYIVSD